MILSSKLWSKEYWARKGPSPCPHSGLLENYLTDLKVFRNNF